MSALLARAIDAVRSAEWRRETGVTLALVAWAAGIFIYLYMAARYLPDLGLQMLLAGALFALLVFTGPTFTFALYFATTFGTGIEVPGVPMSLNRVLGVVFLAAWALSLFRRPLRLPGQPAFVVLAIYTIYAVIGGIALKVPEAPASVQPVIYLLVGIALASTMRSREEIFRLVGVIVAISCAIQVFGLVEFILRRDMFPQYSDYTFYDYDLRINGISKNAIQYAYVGAWAIPWAMLLALESRSRAVRRWSLVAIVYLVVLCLLTYNRQSPIIIGAMAVTGVILARTRHKPVMLGGIALAALAAIPLVLGRMLARFGQLGAEGRPDMSLAIRQDKALAAREMIAERPWFGVGFDNFKDLWYQYKVPGEFYIIHFEKGKQHYVDMGYLQILTETGVVGALLFLALTVLAARLWWRCYRRARTMADSTMQNLLAVTSMGFVQLYLSLLLQDNVFIPRTFFQFAFLFAAAMILMRRPGRETVAPPGAPIPARE